MFEPLPEADERHDYYTVVTLIDISASNASHHYPKGMDNTMAWTNIIRNQRRNLNSFVQSIGLRAQPVYMTDPIPHYNQTLSTFGFGTDYKTATMWSFNFGVEHKGIYDYPLVPHGGLLDDLHNVPIVTGLLETVIIDPAMIDTCMTKTKNTIILK